MSQAETALRIRRYRAEDHDAVWTLHNLALDDAGAHGGNGPWDDDLHQIPSAYIAARGDFLIGLLNGEIVAMGALRRAGPRKAEIKRMRVAPRFQRRGFGRRMLERLEQRGVELGYETLILDTTVGQIAAQALYQRHGYAEVGRTRIGRFDVILFEKAIGRASLET